MFLLYISFFCQQLKFKLTRKVNEQMCNSANNFDASLINLTHKLLSSWTFLLYLSRLERMRCFAAAGKTCDKSARCILSTSSLSHREMYVIHRWQNSGVVTRVAIFYRHHPSLMEFTRLYHTSKRVFFSNKFLNAKTKTVWTWSLVCLHTNRVTGSMESMITNWNIIEPEIMYTCNYLCNSQ